MRSNVKEGQWKVCDSEFILSSLCTNAPKPFLVSIGVWLSWCEERFATYLLPQILSRFLIEVDKFYTGSWFPIVHIPCYRAGWNQEKSTEYMEVQILDSLSARMRQQPKGCGSSVLQPHQNITLGSYIALCSMLELFCCIWCYQVF